MRALLTLAFLTVAAQPQAPAQETKRPADAPAEAEPGSAAGVPPAEAGSLRRRRRGRGRLATLASAPSAGPSAATRAARSAAYCARFVRRARPFLGGIGPAGAGAGEVHHPFELAGVVEQPQWVVVGNLFGWH